MALSKLRKLKYRREKLWKANPHCHWCNTLTVLPNGDETGKPPPNLATIDHLRCRLHPQRQEPNDGKTTRTVLSCWQCNNERNREEMKEAGLEKLQQNSGSLPATREQLLRAAVIREYLIKDYKRYIKKQERLVQRLRKALIRNGLQTVSDNISPVKKEMTRYVDF